MIRGDFMNCETCAYQTECKDHDYCYVLEMIYKEWIRAIERTKKNEKGGDQNAHV